MKKTLISIFLFGILFINVLTVSFPTKLFGAEEAPKGTLERWAATDEEGNQIGWVYYCDENPTSQNCSPIGSYYVVYS